MGMRMKLISLLSPPKLEDEHDACRIDSKRREGDALLLVCRKGGMVEALSDGRGPSSNPSLGPLTRSGKDSLNYEGSQTLVFSLKEPNSCFVKNNGIRISIKPKVANNKGWDFEIRGYFPDRNCSIVDIRSNVIAQVGVNKEVEKLMESKDVYNVVVKLGMDQTCAFGVIAVPDYIYRESTYC
ncbi:hypothetical protein VNO80_30666 [Phaseolus coccineus]|uniref:Uncharacterized protein n=1 Tax=Phaseolus coccineus TaxID=3886 RepID=A0AAN9LDD0_PHACN